jgi:hypothetical protein
MEKIYIFPAFLCCSFLFFVISYVFDSD